MNTNLIFIVLGFICVVLGAILKITNLANPIFYNGLLIIGLLFEVWAIISYLRPKSKQQTLR